MYSAAQAGRTSVDFVDAAPTGDKVFTDLAMRAILSGDYRSVPDPRRTLIESLQSLEGDQLDFEHERLGELLKEAKKRGEHELARELSIQRLETRRRRDLLTKRPEEDPR